MSPALWLPLIWILLASTRFVSQWLAILGLSGGNPGADLEDGSPLDAVVFLGLMGAGIAVLVRRKVKIGELISKNRWLTLFLIYCLVSIFWSDFPFIASKRWIKTLGHPVMALIILTEADRLEGLGRLLKRGAYIYVPLSILCIKVLPEIGRGFDRWSGRGFMNGLSLSKNELGCACMLFALGLSWILLRTRTDTNRGGRGEMAITFAFLGMIWWLFALADSATSFVCTMLGLAVMIAVGLPGVNRRPVGIYIVATLVVVGAIDEMFGAYAWVLSFLGRDPTLTDRTQVWADLISMNTNPLVGAGFESFWLGPRLAVMWSKWWWQPIQAHNGYLETYLNLGWIGVGGLAVLIVIAFRKSRRELIADVDLGRFRMAMLFVVIAYNYTEATFRGMSVMWTMFYVAAIDYPRIPAIREAIAVAPARIVRRWTASTAGLPAAWNATGRPTPVYRGANRREGAIRPGPGVQRLKGRPWITS